MYEYISKRKSVPLESYHFNQSIISMAFFSAGDLHKALEFERHNRKEGFDVRVIGVVEV